MQYREFGKIDYHPSLLGFGCMRLPVINGETKNINEAEAIKMIRHAIDHGVNYVDTAYGYHGGNSEFVVGKALKDGYRAKTALATKNPTYLVESGDHWDQLLDEQLKKLDVDQIDFYLQHTLDAELWGVTKKYKLWERAEAAKKAGKIKYYGFSFHDSYEVFEEIINSYDWDFCQIQMNYLDTERQATLKGLELAAKKGIRVVIMEPLQGGRLANLPDDIAARFNQSQVKHTPVEWALRFLANRPEVALVLSGMSTMSQVKDNLRICSQSDLVPGCMTEAELNLLHEISTYWHSKLNIGCTACRYCMPCPNGVDIPAVFAAWNLHGSSNAGAVRSAHKAYQELITNHTDASLCIACGACEAACPQHLSIITKLQEAKTVLE